MIVLLRKLQFLAAALLVSLGVNVGLGCALWRAPYLQPQKLLPELPLNHREIDQTNCNLLHQMSNWDYARLTSELSNQEIVEDGYGKSALALAVLIANFDFDVQRALGSKLLQKCYLKSGENASSYELIGGLDISDFTQIQQFAHRERWPITERGLHRLIQQNRGINCSFQKSDEEKSLVQAFTASDVFARFEQLFPQDIPATELMLIASYLDWNQLAKVLTVNTSLSTERHRSSLRQQLLFEAIEKDCKTAAYLIILSDFDYAVRFTKDSDLAMLLCLLDTYTAEAMSMALSILNSSRENNIRALAAKKAGNFLDIPLPMREDQWKWLARIFLGQSPIDSHLSDAISQSAPVLQEINQIPSTSKENWRNDKTHIVQSGDSLWKLSKKYGMSVQELINLNELPRDLLKIGQVLQIEML